jgi:hypothetical protein
MRCRDGVIGLVVVAGLGAGTSLLACGDKFLVAGRGGRFQRGSAHPVVLIYAPPSSALNAELKNLSVEKVLTLSGYRPATAVSAEELGQALAERHPDVVLVDVGEAPSVEKLSLGGSTGPAILPVLFKATRQDLSEARKTWGVALKSPASSDSLLDAVDEAIALRARAIKNASLTH